MDSGFYGHTVVAACREMDVRFSITVRQHARLQGPEDWYWMDGAADVRRVPDQAGRRAGAAHCPAGSQLALFATYRYHGFITDRVTLNW